MAERTVLDPSWPWMRDFRISQGIQIGDMVHTSGQIAFDPEGNVIGGNDMKAQSRQVFENVRAVLAEAGATMEDVVKITVFLTDIGRYAEFAEARAGAFPNNVPASTVVSTPALVRPDLLVEVEAIAKVGSGGS